MAQKYAIIQNGKVINVAVSETALEPNWIQSDIAQAGDDYVNGQFITPAPDVTLIASGERAKRNALLSECDWTQVADAPVDKAAWAIYRQALRDVPAQPGFPTNIDWPIPPEVA